MASLVPPPRRRFNVRIPLRDGINLAADLTFPQVLPAPALVMRTPYGKGGEVPTRRAEDFAAGGYVFVTVDVRGRGDSDGTFVPYRNDGPDGHDVIEWLAAQEWCTGAVASYGGSYPGQIQYLAALERPPSLRAMVVMVTPSDPFVEDRAGVFSPMHVDWFRLVDGRVPQYQGGVDWMTVYRHRPLLTMDEAAGFVSENWRESLRHRPLDDFWAPLRYQDRIAEITVPVLHISGWYDDEEIGTPANFAALSAAGRHGQRLLMGPWGHQVNDSRTVGDVDFGPEAVIDLNGHVLRFLDEHLRDRPADGGKPVRIFVMGANEWRDEDAWPPPDVTATTLHLHGGGRANSLFGDGTLSPDPPGDEPPDQWIHDPADPVPYPTGASSRQIGGPDDCAGVQARSDVLVYTTDPFDEPIDIIGPVRLIAHVETSAPDTDVVARLSLVGRAGRAQRLCDGMIRLRYREGFERELRAVHGEVYEVEVAMWDTAQRVLRGQRLRLDIAASAFPKHEVNLGTGGDVITETTGVLATNTLWHTGERPSRLILLTRRAP
ncbi:MAG: CocE/NonD family hydrolase [Candidatus Dormibacteria bacterium]